MAAGTLFFGRLSRLKNIASLDRFGASASDFRLAPRLGAFTGVSAGLGLCSKEKSLTMLESLITRGRFELRILSCPKLAVRSNARDALV